MIVAEEVLGAPAWPAGSCPGTAAVVQDRVAGGEDMGGEMLLWEKRG